MSRPLLVDLFCGAGGCAKGYHEAGFDILGVDKMPQPHYPFRFVQADALEFLDTYLAAGMPADALHGSPPCQDHMRGGSHPVHGTGWLLAATRDRFARAGLPWVIENVPGAPMRADYMLCGCMFGLHVGAMQLVRERWFETSWRGFELRAPCEHGGRFAVSVTGHGTTTYARDKLGRNPTIAEYRALMGGVDWMNRDELSQAIPPAYTRLIGSRLLQHIHGAAA